MEAISIFIEGNPSTRTAQQKGVTVIKGRVHHYEKKEVRLAKEALMYHLMSYRPKAPIEGPVEVFIEWKFGLKKCKRTEWKITRPDLDNLEKNCLDCLTACGFWKDDAQIVSKTTMKMQVPDGEGSLYIRIESLREDQS